MDLFDLILLVAGLIFGCIICFNGYKFFRLSLAIIGGALGFAAGNLLVTLIQNGGGQLPQLWRYVIVIALTIGFAAGAFALYLKALIAVCALFCTYFFYRDYDMMFPDSEKTKMIICVAFVFAAGIIIGIVVYYAQKWTICMFTSFAGARIIAGIAAPLIYDKLAGNVVVQSIEDNLLGARITGTPALTSCFILVAFAAAGFVIQLKSTKRIKN